MIPLAGLTAYQALFEVANLQAGQKILVHAAPGGVGHIAVQLAKWKGAYVAGTASKRNLEFIRCLGAHEAFDYSSGQFETALRDFDVVLDAVGGGISDRSYGVLKRGGILVSISGGGNAEKAREYGVRQASMLVRPDRDQLDFMARSTS